jgi:sugar (pentulose or hexulose) kinase
MKDAYFLGIDVGTQGARIVLLDDSGDRVASAEETFPLSDAWREEQSPEQWWETCLRLLGTVTGSAKGIVDLASVKAVGVTSTSGTVIPLDAMHEPLHNAIMYSDPRSEAEGLRCKAAAVRYHPGGYSGFNASSGLSKMLWFVGQYPSKAARLHRWAHAADYITGKLSGRWGITDYTNALKSGFDVKDKVWPAYIYEQLPLKKEWLPEVVPSGAPIGVLSAALTAKLGLKDGVQVVAGMTDGCASQIASGAVSLGDWNTTIGTTMVIKGVTARELTDPGDRLYSHRHPEGYWMPGGASNTGGDWVTREFGDDLPALNEAAAHLIPTGLMAWPLVRQGERFPFIAPQARGFAPPGLSAARRFAANMEGVAYIERYAYDMIRKLSGEEIKAVYTAGGASNSEVWLTIRSNVLNLPIYKMRHVTGAAGAAILAASRTHYTSLTEAGRAMTRIEKEIDPQSGMAAEYDKAYKHFLRTLQEKGYIREDIYA